MGLLGAFPRCRSGWHIPGRNATGPALTFGPLRDPAWGRVPRRAGTHRHRVAKPPRATTRGREPCGPTSSGEDHGAAGVSSLRTHENALRPRRSAQHEPRPSRTTIARSRSYRRSAGDVWWAGQTSCSSERAHGPVATPAETCFRAHCAAGATRYPDSEEVIDWPIRCTQAPVTPPGHLPGCARRACALGRRVHQRNAPHPLLFGRLF